jgi:hypothetical protein
MPQHSSDGGLGLSLVGERIVINSRQVAVTKLLGEGTKIPTSTTRPTSSFAALLL